MIDLDYMLCRLSKYRPIFHSEADFQHALAWETQKSYPDFNIRLEIDMLHDRKREYTDIILAKKNFVVAVELKYKTKRINISHNEEHFALLQQGAQDCGRYDFIKDIVRLENLACSSKVSIGYAIMLTNDLSYRNARPRSGTVDGDFNIHDGRLLQGKLKWNGASKGTMEGRESRLVLKGKYKLRWNDYSKFDNFGPNAFKYLMIEVCPMQ
ncbi:MAG: hypothetical protein HY606_15130 [Planctomycetes bacterium]|nr:hypothetical protein [Planctomycetota bacterium]